MKKRILFIVLAVICSIWLFSNCTVQINMDNEKSALLETDRDFSAYSVEYGAAEAFNKYLLEEAFQLPAGQHPIYGRENIYLSMKDGDEEYTLSWEPQDADVASSGDMGWSWGIYTITFQTEEGETSRQGKYMNVWEKDANGDWRVLIDMGNQNPMGE